MNKNVFLLFIIIGLTSCASSLKYTSIYIAGDSTAQTYEESRDGLIKGWGQMLPLFLDEKIKVDNRAIGGRSTKTFISEGRWEKLVSDLKPGDFVFIQFGHNDASTRPDRHASYDDYRVNLIRMIEDARAKKANPVLLTSVVMRTFVNGNLVDDRLKGYPVITREVAKAYNVPMLDINLKSRDFITMLGDKGSIPYYRWLDAGIDHKKPDGIKDDTHMMEKGAKKIAEFVTESIKEQKIKGLSNHVLSNHDVE